MTTIPECVEIDLVACLCGHLRDQHDNAFFAPCNECGDCDDYAADPDDIHRQAQEHGSLYVTDRFTLAEAVTLIQIPTERWPGNCFAIATALFEGAQQAGTPTGGRVVYGHYRGFMHPDGYFGNRAGMGFTNHGWIDLGDGNVVDPTRWVFENVSPYVYEGPGDDYDEGGNVLRAERTRPCPPVSDTTTALVVPANVSDFLIEVSCGVLQPATDGLQAVLYVDFAQRMWLANLALDTLGDYAAAVYTALIDTKSGGLIPFDNRRKVLPA